MDKPRPLVPMPALCGVHRFMAFLVPSSTPVTSLWHYGLRGQHPGGPESKGAILLVPASYGSEMSPHRMLFTPQVPTFTFFLP